MSEENISKLQPSETIPEVKMLVTGFMFCLHPEKFGVCGATLNTFSADSELVKCMYGHTFHVAIVRKKFFKAE